MIDTAAIQRILAGAGMETWAECLPGALAQILSDDRHGDLGRWRHLLQMLPSCATRDVNLVADCIRIGREDDIGDRMREDIFGVLRALQPWRKGPYEVFGIHIDTEWRSDWKWRRLRHHIQHLRGRKVLDVGCGNGYHAWRMAGEGAELVVGIDPSLLFLAQFNAIRHLMKDPPNVHFLPLGIEAVPPKLAAFDTVFSMGILYHRRSPMDHLFDLKGCLRPGGELVLETLVVEGGEHTVLMPRGRYAKMRNVWFIPSTEALENWLRRCGFKNVRTVDVTVTGIDEQRSTSWMAFESLPDFLNPGNHRQTIEGYPAPVRAVVLATA